jgi:hypothetical protein
MADNAPFTADPTQIIAADDIGGVKHQRVKVEVGSDGAANDVIGNVDITVLASAARTTTTASAEFANYSGRGGIFVLDLTAFVTAASLTLNVQGKDVTSGKYYNILTATTVTATGTFVYEIFPGSSAAAGAGVTARQASVLPAVFRANITHGNANSHTYSVGVSLLSRLHRD